VCARLNSNSQNTSCETLILPHPSQYQHFPGLLTLRWKQCCRRVLKTTRFPSAKLDLPIYLPALYRKTVWTVRKLLRG
jgi:hypothetical protein